MSTPEAGLEPDRTGHPRSGDVSPGRVDPSAPAAVPNGDLGARFDGNGQYLEVPNADQLSITTTRSLAKA